MTDYAITVTKRDGHHKNRTMRNNASTVLKDKDNFVWYEGIAANTWIRFGIRKDTTAAANNDTITLTLAAGS